MQIQDAVRTRAAHDVDPPQLSDVAKYMRKDMSLEGYRHLLAVGEREMQESPRCTICLTSLPCSLMMGSFWQVC